MNVWASTLHEREWDSFETEAIGWLLTATWTYAVSLIWQIGDTIFKFMLNSIPGFTETNGADHELPVLEGECPPPASSGSSLTVNLSEGGPPYTPLPEPPPLPIVPDEQDFLGMGNW
ncbi:hypothetical protein CLAIMM_04940 [Cladophialophora immunda]|nr:hypothetical protein CLAIMM_04940 [Cladophialophora immunda]